MDLDTFFVSVERKQDSSLIGKPVLVGSMNRGVVASCSYEARTYGIHSAMPMYKALKLCPDAIVVSGRTDRYSYYSQMVTDIIRERVPLYEKTSIDEFYIDLTGVDRFFGCYKLATELRQTIIRETGLPISFAMGANKTVAKVGTGEAKPNGQMQIMAGTEKEFLAPLPVRKIPMAGKKTCAYLNGIGVEYVRDFQRMPIERVEREMGRNGVVLWKKVHGIDNSPVIAYSERKSISSEQTFGADTNDLNFIKSVLVSMTENLAFQLRDEGKLTACASIKIRYSNFETHSMQAMIPYSSADHVLIKKIKELFIKAYHPYRQVRLIGVRFSHLVQGGHQISLFEDTTEMINLYQAVDNVKKRFGNSSVQRAIGMEVTHRNFNPFNGAGSGLSGKKPTQSSHP